MPIDRKRYPPDWEQISYRIRFERAGGICEHCGAEHDQPHPVTGNIVCLQCAHINRTPMDSRDENLLALCARCHFAFDRADNQAKKRYRNYFRRGQTVLPFIYENSPVSSGTGL